MTTPTEQVIRQWMDAGTRVHASWATGTGTQAVGRVIAYCPDPMLMIESDDGEMVYVSVRCTFTEATTRAGQLAERGEAP